MDELRARIPLSDIVGKRMKLTRAGREYKGCCPFHKEKSPSFTVNDVKGFYHCFGCGEHGDSIGFLMKHDNLSFMDAVTQLASLAGMQVPKATPEDEKKYKEQASLYGLMDFAARWYEQQLHDGKNKKILRYLLERGLSLDTIRGFKLGFSPQDEKGLQEALLKAGFKISAMVEAGLFKNSTRNQNDIYQFFRSRVMFPVQDFQGRVVAFGGRVLPEHYGGPAGKEAPKYINSPETNIFHKGRLLYGLSRARKAIGDGEVVVVVEGYMDVISLAQAGFKAAVAPLGTALTETQMLELWKVMPEGKRAPLLCFDGDAAGQRAAGRALERALPILKPDHSIKFAFLPKEHDPDSLIKEAGVPAMERVLKNAVGLFEMLWMEEFKGRQMSQPEAKAGFRSALEKRARQIADMNVQQFFIHEINQNINDIFLTKSSAKKQSLAKPLFKGKKPQMDVHTPYRPLAVRAGQVRSDRSQQMERVRILLALMIHYPELYEEFGESLGMIKITNTEYDQLRQTLINLLGEQNSLDYQAVKQHLSDSGHGKALEMIFDRSLYLHAGFARPGQQFDVVREAWREIWERGFMNVRAS
ncbi:MAG: DNA primase [Proteobacteria bacterium]|nr:DNA primase [Pseudomonadota bacterium]